MFKPFIAVIFLLAFLTQTFSRTIIVMDYYANMSTYAKQCENKAMVSMHCNGKCHMMQKLKQEDNKDEQFPERKAELKNEITLSSKSYFANAVLFPFAAIGKKYAGATVEIVRHMPRSIFHPPDKLSSFA
ncbi:MAG: hypothetical protein QM802_25020 [Agriterribacter sp.]